MSREETILIVDDTAANLAVLSGYLKNRFDLVIASSGKDALAIIEKEPIDLILLDVMMPGMDGYEVCQQVKDNPATSGIPIIFVSALTSAEEQIRGLEVGAEDYIPKPVDKNILLAKIEKAFDNKKLILSQQAQLTEAQTTVKVFLENIYEIGYISNYFSELSLVNNFDDLIQLLKPLFASLKLMAIIKISPESEQDIYASTSGTIKPMEIELFGKLQTNEVIYTYKTVNIFNYPNISILLLNMPTDNEAHYSRLKDHLSTILHGTTNAIQAIASEKKFKKLAAQQQHQNEKLTQLVETIETVLAIIETQHQDHQKANKQIMNTLLDKVNQSFYHLGLTEAQEQDVMQMVTNADDETQTLFDKNMLLEQKVMMLRALINL